MPAPPQKCKRPSCPIIGKVYTKNRLLGDLDKKASPGVISRRRLMFAAHHKAPRFSVGGGLLLHFGIAFLLGAALNYSDSDNIAEQGYPLAILFSELVDIIDGIFPRCFDNQAIPLSQWQRYALAVRRCRQSELKWP